MNLKEFRILLADCFPEYAVCRFEQASTPNCDRHQPIRADKTPQLPDRSFYVRDEKDSKNTEYSGVREGSVSPRILALGCSMAFYCGPTQRTMAQKTIITCAITGAIHTPSMSPYLPVTPQQIAEAAIAAAEAGAAIVHLHARDPETGKPDQTPAAFAAFLPRIKQSTDAVVNLTSGGSPYMKIEERIQPALIFKPELASLNMGSMNFGLFPMLMRFKEFRHAWEREHLEGSRDLIFRNTFRDAEYALRTCAGNGTRFEFECYDVGHLYNLAHFLDRGLVERPLFVQTVFGILDASSFRSPPWPLGWAATYGWDWKTTYGSDRGSWPPATQLKCIAPARLSMIWDWKSQHQPMHVRS
jgi:uncharacterized protein (DUF849 family)